MSDADKPQMTGMSPGERLARAVLMFHASASIWTPQNRNIWRALTGKEEATSRVLCDLARELLNRSKE
jgi:hypothetical protein